MQPTPPNPIEIFGTLTAGVAPVLIAHLVGSHYGNPKNMNAYMNIGAVIGAILAFVTQRLIVKHNNNNRRN